MQCSKTSKDYISQLNVVGKWHSFFISDTGQFIFLGPEAHSLIHVFHSFPWSLQESSEIMPHNWPDHFLLYNSTKYHSHLPSISTIYNSVNEKHS